MVRINNSPFKSKECFISRKIKTGDCFSYGDTQPNKSIETLIPYSEVLWGLNRVFMKAFSFSDRSLPSHA